MKRFARYPWVIILTLLVLISCRHRNEKQPDISGLKDSLEQSAERQFPLPAMTDGNLSLPVPQAERAAEAERINQLALELGGGCLHTDLPNGEVSLMIQVPARAEKIFRARLLHKPISEIKVAPPEDSQVWIDITLRDPA